jgi:trehalose/maltose hydrolase-like predicted phosphorylase
MKLIKIALCLLLLTRVGYSQTHDDLIKLAKFYRNFHFANDPPQEVQEQLKSITAQDLQVAKNFIGELVKKNNRIATTPYLIKPDSVTLKYLYTIRAINWNMYEADPVDNHFIIDSLSKTTVNKYELLACYYGMLFVSIGNKNTPFDMAEVNFIIDDYKLEDDTEKGIFFLKGMETFGVMIWGYMNIPKPPNYTTFNSQPYYQFQDLKFKDFDLTIDKTKPKESFKKYYLNKYLNTLLYHTICLGQSKKKKKEMQDVMLGSIMRNDSYYKYSDNPEIFEQMFKK